MNALEALGDDGAHAEQARALCGPVARRSGAVLLAAEDHERNARSLVRRGGVEDGLHLAREQVARESALDAGAVVLVGKELVAQADVRERAANHHLVVAAARAVRVEVPAVDAVLGEVLAGRRVGLDGAGGRDVVGRDGVAEQREHASARDVLDRAPE